MMVVCSLPLSEKATLSQTAIATRAKLKPPEFFTQPGLVRCSHGSSTSVISGSDRSILPRSANSFDTAGAVSIFRNHRFQKRTSAFTKQCQITFAFAGGGSSGDGPPRATICSSHMLAQPIQSMKGSRLHIRQRPQSSLMMSSTS